MAEGLDRAEVTELELMLEVNAHTNAPYPLCLRDIASITPTRVVGPEIGATATRQTRTKRIKTDKASAQR